MSIKDYFKPVTSMSAEDIREFLKEKNPDDYNLIDVRMPEEYETGHIPGARLIPLDTIKEHENELDHEKPTIAY
jgi:rhodanese-related sulfurtransferase